MVNAASLIVVPYAVELTRTLTTPDAGIAGVHATTMVSLAETTVAGVKPNSTVTTSPRDAARFVPEICTKVPPFCGPEDGDT